MNLKAPEPAPQDSLGSPFAGTRCVQVRWGVGLKDSKDFMGKWKKPINPMEHEKFMGRCVELVG